MFACFRWYPAGREMSSCVCMKTAVSPWGSGEGIMRSQHQHRKVMELLVKTTGSFFSVALFYMLIVVANLKGSLDLRLEPQSKSTISVPESLSAHHPAKIGRFWEITTVSYHKSMTLKEAEYTVNWRVIEWDSSNMLWPNVKQENTLSDGGINRDEAITHTLFRTGRVKAQNKLEMSTLLGVLGIYCWCPYLFRPTCTWWVLWSISRWLLPILLRAFSRIPVTAG